MLWTTYSPQAWRQCYSWSVDSMPVTARTVTCIATFSTIYMHHDMLASLHRLRLHFKNSEYHYLDVTLIIHALLLLPPPLFVSNNVKFVQNKSANVQTHEEIALPQPRSPPNAIRTLQPPTLLLGIWDGYGILFATCKCEESHFQGLD